MLFTYSSGYHMAEVNGKVYIMYIVGRVYGAPVASDPIDDQCI